VYWFRQRGTLLNVDMGGVCRTKTGAPMKIQTGEYQPPRTPRIRGRASDFSW
jgi:hypothetical protein